MKVFNKSVDELTREDKMYLIQYGLKKWIDWEKESKIIYEDAYHNLIKISEVASAEFIMRYVRDVDQELKDAEILFRVRNSIGWDLPTIYDKQAKLGKR